MEASSNTCWFENMLQSLLLILSGRFLMINGEWLLSTCMYNEVLLGFENGF